MALLGTKDAFFRFLEACWATSTASSTVVRDITTPFDIADTHYGTFSVDSDRWHLQIFLKADHAGNNAIVDVVLPTQGALNTTALADMVSCALWLEGWERKVAA